MDVKQGRSTSVPPEGGVRLNAPQLQVLSESLDLLDEEVDVRLGGSVIGDDHAEEVDLVSLRLVAHHGGAALHHHGFDLRRHLDRVVEDTLARVIAWLHGTCCVCDDRCVRRTLCRRSLLSSPSGMFLIPGGMYQKHTLVCWGWRHAER